MSLDKQVQLAQTKSELHAMIDSLNDNDSVVLLIGERLRDEEGYEGGRVNMRRRNCHHFEAVGIVRHALTVLSRPEAD